MSKKITLTLIACAALGAGLSKNAYAQSTVIVPVTPPPPRVAAERNVLPNAPLLSSGVGAFTVSYVPSVITAMVSDHKGDDNLYIPVVGPWIDLANRGCSGVTVLTEGGPLEVSSGRHCGTSGIEGFFLVASGIVQGVGALGIIGAFVVPQRAFVVAEPKPKTPSFAIAPTSFGGRGAGAVAVGNF